MIRKREQKRLGSMGSMEDWSHMVTLQKSDIEVDPVNWKKYGSAVGDRGHFQHVPLKSRDVGIAITHDQNWRQDFGIIAIGDP